MMNRNFYFFNRFKFYICRQDIYEDKTVIFILKKTKDMSCSCKIIEADRLKSTNFLSTTFDVEGYLQKIIEVADNTKEYKDYIEGDFQTLKNAISSIYKGSYVDDIIGILKDNGKELGLIKRKKYFFW